MTPKEHYQAELERAGFTHDPAQAAAVEHFEKIYSALTAGRPAPKLLRALGARKRETSPVRGLYLWGGVGRGKTLLVDAFYDCLPPAGKRRVHFHTFMRGIHAELKALKRAQRPLERVAARWAAGLRVICLDEFHVADITDAMLLARLLEALFKRGVTLVTTSNEAPDQLYRGGLQRERFLPAIALLKQHLEVFELAGTTDYRLRALTQAAVYRASCDAAAEAALGRQFANLTVGSAHRTEPLDVDGRAIPVRCEADGVVWFDFATLCGGARSTGDYIEIARCFHTVLLSGVPQLGDDDNDAARRFINLVDEFYDRNVNLLLTAVVAPEYLYTGNRLAPPFKRCLSRLKEMQSEEYLARPHLGD